ncbi:MAG: NAD-dependent protein deacetylase [Pseudonocardia sp.]
MEQLVAAADRAAVLLRGRRIVALTGAGVSTDSGIPDYRGPGTPRRTPMTYAEFVSGEAARRRYWARSHAGWSRVWQAAPNAGHAALVELERAGMLTGLITQTVDGLHAAAGSRAVVDLHGRIADVVCLGCRAVSPRAELARRLAALNPDFAGSGAALRPDGDAELDDVSGFRIADCSGCGGVLKPDVVFFGENVPRERVARCYAAVDALVPGGALLVAGSSLHVLSGLRFVRHAHRLGVTVVIVNRGVTRGDDLADVQVDAGCSETLTALVAVVAAKPLSRHLMA